MLGPSGSGKTTTLRLIAGFERPDAGTVELDGVDVTSRPPYERDVNTVFQDYALFPHMTVAENVAYGLQVKGVGRARARRARRRGARRWCASPDVGERKPIQLSGGQRQRVALARALVNRPARAAARRAARRARPQAAPGDAARAQGHPARAERGITFIYVTHDQDEALTMSDRIAVFSDGRIEQVGTPGEIYEHPANEFVAGFVGTRTSSSATARASPCARRRSACSTTARRRRAGCDARAGRGARGRLPRLGHALRRRARRRRQTLVVAAAEPRDVGGRGARRERGRRGAARVARRARQLELGSDTRRKETQ